MYTNQSVRARSRFASPHSFASALLLLLVLAACAGNPRDQDAEGATARVENQSWSEMTIYAVAGGQRVRLGSVNANSTAVLRIPAGVVGLGRTLTFIADPLGSSRTSRSFEIYVAPGEEITLTIPPQAGS